MSLALFSSAIFSRLFAASYLDKNQAMGISINNVLNLSAICENVVFYVFWLGHGRSPVHRRIIQGFDGFTFAPVAFQQGTVPFDGAVSISKGVVRLAKVNFSDNCLCNQRASCV